MNLIRNIFFSICILSCMVSNDTVAQEKADTQVLSKVKGRSAQTVHSEYDSMDANRKASYENLRHLRPLQRQEPPVWVKEYVDSQVEARLARMRKDYEEGGVWFYCKYKQTDCGTTVWWDEVATARNWSEMLNFLGGYEKLPHYSPENREKAIAFWQSWQNAEDGCFYNPFMEDPHNPGTWRNTDGYNLAWYRNRGGLGVVQKYVPGILKALGAEPLYETLATQVAVTDNEIPIEKLEQLIRKGDGNWGGQMLHLMAERIDAGQNDLIADYERIMSLLLQQFNPETGMLGVGPETDVNNYGISAMNVKGFARIVGYDGLENFPYRHELANALADQVGKTLITPAGAVRNYAYLMTLCLQQSDSREQDMFREIAEIVEILRNSAPNDEGYKWMALSTASSWLNWGIAPVEAFLDPSAAQCQNGVTRPNRSVVGPFGRWVNVIPKKPEEIYGHPGFSWDKYGLRERNQVHERKKIIDIVPTVSEGNSQWRWTSIHPDVGWSRGDFNDKDWEQGRFEVGDGKKALWMRYEFKLEDHKSIESPYIKAKWQGEYEIFLNGVLVKKVSGNFPEYCGLHIPKEAGETLRKGSNVIAVKAVNPNSETMIDAGMIDWRLLQESNDTSKTTLITYPAPESETESKDFSMTVNREPVFVSDVRVSADPINQVWPGHQRPKDQTEMASFTYFDFEGGVNIEIESKRPVETITIRPKSAGISHSIRDNKIIISLDKPQKFVVEVNDHHHALHVFANSIEKDKPDPGDPNVRYFAPGVHQPGIMKMKSGETIYIAGGAVVYGAIDAMDVSDVRILGRGILDAGKLRRFGRKDHEANSTVAIGGSENVKVNGIICRNSFKWTIVASRSSDVSISDVKLIGMWRYNADGIDIVNSDNVTIDNCFIRAFDDCICIKGSEKPDGWKVPPSEENRDVKNIYVSNCIIWNDWGVVFKIGTETIADSILNYTVENCDVLHYVHSCFAIYNGNQAFISKLRFQNIRIEDVLVENVIREDKEIEEQYKPEGLGKLVFFNFDQSLWNKREGENYDNCGGIHDILFKDISYSGKQVVTSNLIGENKNRKISNILFSNLILQGKHVMNKEDAKLETNEFVENVRFE